MVRNVCRMYFKLATSCCQFGHYALESTQEPIGIAEYQLETVVPEEIQTQLPTIEEIKKELEKEKGNEQS